MMVFSGIEREVQPGLEPGRNAIGPFDDAAVGMVIDKAAREVGRLQAVGRMVVMLSPRYLPDFLCVSLSIVQLIVR
jgi:hypothetical protein